MKDYTVTDELLLLLFQQMKLTPSHQNALELLHDEGEYYRKQFDQFTDIEDALSLLCSTPIFVEVYDANYRYDLEQSLIHLIKNYLYHVPLNNRSFMAH